MFQKDLRLNRDLLIPSTNLFLLHILPHFSKWKAKRHCCLNQRWGHSRALSISLWTPIPFVTYKMAESPSTHLQSPFGVSFLLNFHCHSRCKPPSPYKAASSSSPRAHQSASMQHSPHSKPKCSFTKPTRLGHLLKPLSIFQMFLELSSTSSVV